MIPEKLKKVESSHLEQAIADAQVQIQVRRNASGVHADRLRRGLHAKLTTPAALAGSAVFGFLLDRTGWLRPPPTPSSVNDRRKENRPARSETVFKRLSGIFTIVTTAMAVLTQLDDYADKMNRKHVDLERSAPRDVVH